MKNILILVLFFGLNDSNIYAQVDSQARIEIKKMETKLSSLDTSLKKLDTLFVNQIKKEACLECKKNSDNFNNTDRLVIFLFPAVLILFSVLLLLRFLKSNELGLKRVFGLGDGDPNNINASKFIAALTGLVAIFISAALTMYHGYSMVSQCNQTLSLDGLWKVLISLGIGIVPYGIYLFKKNGDGN